jgi:hypothetical protein
VYVKPGSLHSDTIEYPNGITSAIIIPDCRISKVTLLCKYKGKANPLEAWTGPEGSRRLKIPDFKTIDT